MSRWQRVSDCKASAAVPRYGKRDYPLIIRIHVFRQERHLFWDNIQHYLEISIHFLAVQTALSLVTHQMILCCLYNISIKISAFLWLAFLLPVSLTKPSRSSSLPHLIPLRRIYVHLSDTLCVTMGIAFKYIWLGRQLHEYGSTIFCQLLHCASIAP